MTPVEAHPLRPKSSRETLAVTADHHTGMHPRVSMSAQPEEQARALCPLFVQRFTLACEIGARVPHFLGSAASDIPSRWLVRSRYLCRSLAAECSPLKLREPHRLARSWPDSLRGLGSGSCLGPLRLGAPGAAGLVLRL
jgi:hypothetical protein